MKHSTPAALIFSLNLVSPAALGADDAGEGRDLFIRQCIGCHAFACNRDGAVSYAPKLGGLFGRKAGGVEDFDGYSDGLRNADFIWTDETVDAYLEDPAAISAESAMAFEKVADAAQRRQLIAYLKTEDPSADLFCPD